MRSENTQNREVSSKFVLLISFKHASLQPVNIHYSSALLYIFTVFRSPDVWV